MIQRRLKFSSNFTLSSCTIKVVSYLSISCISCILPLCILYILYPTSLYSVYPVSYLSVSCISCILPLCILYIPTRCYTAPSTPCIRTGDPACRSAPLVKLLRQQVLNPNQSINQLILETENKKTTILNLIS